jgi:hypothetical protein
MEGTARAALRITSDRVALRPSPPGLLDRKVLKDVIGVKKAPIWVRMMVMAVTAKKRAMSGFLEELLVVNWQKRTFCNFVRFVRFVRSLA